MVSASVTTTVGQNVASHSERRYQALASRFHFLRLRSMPSTLSATGMPETARQQREDRVGAVAVERHVHPVRQQVQVESPVCASVSKYLCRMVGRYCSRTPR